MAKMTYGIYLDHAPHCYIISNADTEYAEETVPASFTNPPIKMIVLETDRAELQHVFSASDNCFNHPDLVNNLMQALRGELPGWALTGVNIASNGLYLIYRTEHDTDPLVDGFLCNDGQVFPYGNYKLLFEVDHADELPIERYEVEYRNAPRYVLDNRKAPDPQDIKRDMQEVSIVRITEYIGSRKRRLLEMRDDNHDQPCIQGKQYCLITEY